MNLHSDFVSSVRDGKQREVPPKPARSWNSEYAKWRFLRAVNDHPEIGLDHAVLLRQAVRWAPREGIFVGHVCDALRHHFSQVDLEFSYSGWLTARPYRPEWLRPDLQGLGADGLDAPPTYRSIEESLPAEGWLSKLPQHKHWRSLAQKEACWLALHARPGSTTLLGMPTGSGKSLTFQLLASYSKGLTLVIVPTVGLGIDHYIGSSSLLKAFPDVHPTYFEGSDNGRALSVRDLVDQRRCRLLFASPETCVSGRMRPILEKAAAEGWLRNVVIDEAHIIESWGAHFRVDFQVLSGILNLWREKSGDELRTFLLSATFTPDGHDLLRELFASDETRWQAFACQRLRPEMDYFVQQFSSRWTREQAVRQCISRLPRPAIVYVTEVDHATSFAHIAQLEMGLKRVECFHGETSPSRRAAILEAWRGDRLDLIFATSAFGMGIDKPDVRAVVHACLPETMDRYYQEVGRGGRDGASHVCLLLPTEDDEHVATGLAPRLLAEEKLNLRWRALWAESRSVDAQEHIHDLPTDAKHELLIGERSYGENIRWNKRLLLMLARAGRLRIDNVLYERPATDDALPREWVRIKLYFSPNNANIFDLVLNQRSDELRRSQRALSLLRDYVEGRSSICHALRQQYGSVQRSCGSCPACRIGVATPVKSGWLEFPDAISTAPRLALVLSIPDIARPRERDDFIVLVRESLNGQGFKRFVCNQADFPALADVLNEAFGIHGSLYRLDVCDSVVRPRVNPGEKVVCIHLNRYDDVLETMNRHGTEVVHWICTGVTARDAAGRYPLTDRGAALYVTPDAWLAYG